MHKRERRTSGGRVCRRNGEDGSVMMEYIVVTFFVAVAIVFLWHGIFNYAASIDETDTTYYSPSDNKIRNLSAPIGREIHHFFQRLTSGIALPIP